MPDAPVLLAGRYRLGESLGRGGMGQVLLARDETLERDVAVKELDQPIGNDGGASARRTLREARAAARINHPNVVQVYDVLQLDDRTWIVMEYVPCRSLRDEINEQGPLDPYRVARIGLDLLGALRTAHRLGVEHRDVKPANVLLADDGRVLLTDFGIAAVDDDAVISRSDILIGSPQFMAPERAQNGTGGPEADLWSLGATLYSAIEGRAPYERGSTMATLTALTTEEPDPPKRAGALRPLLDGLLRKDPVTRMNSEDAESLARAILAGLSEPGERPPASKPSGGLAGLAAALRIPRSRSGAVKRAEASAAVRGEPAETGPGPDGAQAGVASAEGEGRAPGRPAAGGRDSRPDASAVAADGASAGDAADGGGAAAVPDAAGSGDVAGGVVAGGGGDSAGGDGARSGDTVRDGGGASAGDGFGTGDDASGRDGFGTGDDASGRGSFGTGDVASEGDSPGTGDAASGGERLPGGVDATRPGAGGAVDGVTAAEAGRLGEPAEAGDPGERGESERGGSGAADGPDGDQAAAVQPGSEVPAGRADKTTKQLKNGASGAGPAPVRAVAGRVRRQSRGILVGGVVAALMLAAGTAWAVKSGSGDPGAARPAGTASPGATGAPQTSVGPDAVQAPQTGGASETGGASAAAGAESPVASASADPGAGAPAAGGRPALPDGWRLYKDPTGFSVYVPKGWKWSQAEGDTIVYFRGDGKILGIDQTSRPKSDPVKDWREQADFREKRGDFPGYKEVKIEAVDYFREAADWEFTFSRSGTRRHTNNRGAVVADDKAYGFYWETNDSAWTESRDDLQLVFDSFQPKK